MKQSKTSSRTDSDTGSPTPVSCRLRPWLWLTGLLLLSACAEIGPPPGGPEDRTSPYIVLTEPANGATGVAPGDRVILHFSERVVKPEDQQLVFISPRPRIQPELMWKSDRLEIVLPDSFTVDQTYIVSLSSAIKDLRDNTLDSGSVIAFSTGESIDSGEVSGVVLRDHMPQHGVIVGLYDSTVLSGSMPIDSAYPRYIAQTNTAGFFQFRFLPDQAYRMLAFQDRNRNEKYDTGEPFAVPDRQIRVGLPVSLDSLNLPLHAPDTGVAKIVTAETTKDGLIRVRLNRSISLDYFQRNPSGILLRPASQPSMNYPAGGLVEEYLDTASTLHAYVPDLPEGTYAIEVTYLADSAALLFEELNYSRSEDSFKPRIIHFEPGPDPVFLTDLLVRARFSEAINVASIGPETFILTDSAQSAYPVSIDWTSPLSFTCSSPAFTEGARLRLQIAEFGLSDLSGNRLGDSLREYPIHVLDPDSIGSVSASVSVDLEGRRTDPVVLEFYELATQRSFAVSPQSRSFTTALPAGKYLLRGYVDSDLDGKRDVGSVHPYRFSETYGTFSDTIAVRARFETAGITIEFK